MLFILVYIPPIVQINSISPNNGDQDKHYP